MQFTINPFTHRLDAFEQDLPGGGDVEFLTGNAGGAIPADALHNINVVGAGAANVTGVAGTNTLTITVAGGGLFAWARNAATPIAMASNNGYINTNAGLTTFTLPAAPAVGDVIEIAGEGAGGWTITTATANSIQVGAILSPIAPAVNGSVSSTNRYDCIRMVCRDNTAGAIRWQVTSYNGAFNIL